MSLLLLPNTPQTPIVIAGVSAEQAKSFIESFQVDILRQSEGPNATRIARQALPNLFTPGALYAFDTTPYGLDDIEEFDGLDENDIAHILFNSEFPGVRGERAVFVDEATNTILIGTTVVFNERRFTVGFDDPTLTERLSTAQAADILGEGDDLPPSAATATTPAPVDLRELTLIACALRAKAVPSLLDSVLQKSSVDHDLLSLAERLEGVIAAAGGAPNEAPERRAVDEVIDRVVRASATVREQAEQGINELRNVIGDFLKKR
jgi:hypothetical protein